MKTILKVFKILSGILLLPFCAGAVMALYKTLLENGIGTVSLTFLLGATAWILIYIFLPTPSIVYVFGHEMTHTLWSFLFGGKLKGMKISKEGGHAITTKSNFLTSLSPYFFPFYTVFLIIIFFIGNIFWNWSEYSFVFHFLLGVTYAFHITLTFHALKTKQTDITGQSYVFSGVIIFLGNVLILITGIALFGKGSGLFHSLTLWLQYTAEIYGYFIGLL